MNTIGKVNLNVNGARYSAAFKLSDGVLTVTSAGEVASVTMPDDSVAVDSAARILLRGLVARRSWGSEPTVAASSIELARHSR